MCSAAARAPRVRRRHRARRGLRRRQHGAAATAARRPARSRAASPARSRRSATGFWCRSSTGTSSSRSPTDFEAGVTGSYDGIHRHGQARPRQRRQARVHRPHRRRDPRREQGHLRHRGTATPRSEPRDRVEAGPVEQWQRRLRQPLRRQRRAVGRSRKRAYWCGYVGDGGAGTATASPSRAPTERTPAVPNRLRPRRRPRRAGDRLQSCNGGSYYRDQYVVGQGRRQPALLPGRRRHLHAVCRALRRADSAASTMSTRDLAVRRRRCRQQDVLHNFSFTSEVRYWFKYEAGQTYQLDIVGDDDVWVFVNKKLAVDLGGIHTPVEGSVTLDGTTRHDLRAVARATSTRWRCSRPSARPPRRPSRSP